MPIAATRHPVGTIVRHAYMQITLRNLHQGAPSERRCRQDGGVDRVGGVGEVIRVDTETGEYASLINAA
jgi:hypothetical protein